MRIALIGDIHTYRLKIHPRRFLSRRIMGHTNLWLNRRFRFNHLVLETVLDKIRQIQPDLVLLSGDVTTTSLEDEFLDIERYLRPLSEDVRTILVPGNHDRYTFRSMADRRIERLLHGILPNEFPHFEPLTDKWRLLALDSATPGFVLSRGALGPTQYEGARKRIEAMHEGEGLLVLCHYPIALPAGIPNSWAHALAEEKPLKQLLSNCKARVVFLHGHIHRPWYWHEKSNGRRKAPFACVNAGSPCQTSAQYPLGQGFWEIKLPENHRDDLHLVHHLPIPAHGEIRMTRSERRASRLKLVDLKWRSEQVV